MSRKNSFKFFVFFLFFFSPLFGKTTLLSTSDVHKVMGQLFDYHVDKKEMSTLLIERSISIYLTNFDPNHAYLLMDEVKPFVEAKDGTLRKILSDYEEGKLTAYFTLNETIEKSIQRARSWRAEWNRDPKQLVRAAKAVVDEKFEVQDHYSSNLAQLRNRNRSQYLHVIALMGSDKLDKIISEGKEAKLINLCEKQLTLMENQYLGVDDAGQALDVAEKEHNVVLRTVKAFAHSLDAHTAYYSPDEAHAMRVQLEKGMCGIGVVLHEGIEGVAVNDVIKGGPAEKAGGLVKGDTIVEIDGQDVREYSFHKVLEVLRGDEGSKAVLGVMRQVDNEPAKLVKVSLTRAQITLEDKRVDVSSEPYGDGIIGKVTLYSFYEGSDGISSEKDLRKAIDSLRAQGPLYGLVLDMRENCGGFLSQAVRVSGLFISSGVVVISKYSDGSMKYYRTLDGETYFDGPLVVLISKGSASATEIVAQTLQDYGVALVAGDERTYGKGTIQHQTITSDKSNSFFKVTIGRYYTVSGKSTQIEGVKSDIFIPTALHSEEMGETYLDYPLPADTVEPAFEDSLADIDPYARKWFVKYYLPALQKKVSTWQELLPKLKANSEKRLADNKNFQIFMSSLKEKIEPVEVISHGATDLQMDESVNILKDMIFLREKELEAQALTVQKK